MPIVIIRGATLADLPQIVAMDQAVFGVYGAEESPQIIAARLTVFPEGCFVLEEEGVDGALYGFVGYVTSEKWDVLREPALDEDPHITHRPRGPILNVTTLAVEPKRQGQGLGGRLVAQVINIARSQGCTQIVLETARAEKFYLRHGFEKIGERSQRGIKLTILRLWIETLPPQ